MKNSRLPGFYRLSLSERRRLIAELLELDAKAATSTWSSGGLSDERADVIVENVLGIYALPWGITLNLLMNGVDRIAPMVVEEPSVIAAASNAAKMIRAGGGFSAESLGRPSMIAQIELRKIPSAERFQARLAAEQDSLIDKANQATARLKERGGGALRLAFRELGDGHGVVHLVVDTCDAMGANLVNTQAEAIGRELATLAEAELGLRILTNLCDERLVQVKGIVPFSALAEGIAEGQATAEAIESASRFAEADPYRAATHNKGIMNGIDSVVIATGNDYRAVEAGAHAYAARSGRYAPLSIWRKVDTGLFGEMTLPLAVGTVGGTLRVHDGAALALRIAEVKGAADLAALAACVGLASNLAVLRALATEGIQRGHMALHARSQAIRP